MKIVEFSDGTFALQKGFIFKQYLLLSTRNWIDHPHKFCRGSLSDVKRSLLENEITKMKESIALIDKEISNKEQILYEYEKFVK